MYSVARFENIKQFARAVEAEARRDALEEAAKVADSMAPEFGEKGWAAKERGDLTLALGMLGVEFQLKECAAAIRKLKEDTSEQT